MPLRAYLGALGGAAVGAVAWALIAVVTGYEIGWVAWGVGVLAGGGGAYFGGRGPVGGVTCASLALAAIFAGKMGATYIEAENELESAVEKECSRELYDELREDAAIFADLDSEEDYPQFMAERGYFEVADPEEVTPGTLEEFETYSVPMLRRLAPAGDRRSRTGGKPSSGAPGGSCGRRIRSLES